MKVYIECYYLDGTPILGNLDGQAVIHAVYYRRTNAYKRACNIVGNPKHMSGKVGFARVVTSNGQILETIKPRIAP